MAGLCLFLTACQAANESGPSGDLALNTKIKPHAMIERLAKTAQTCWFRSKDPAFRSLRLANEVTSLSGRPRILLVPRNNPNGLPKLVIQAEKSGKSETGTFTRVQVFGPLLAGSEGQRINADVKRWAGGNSACTAKT